jgi:hypothetical protein
LKIVRVCVVSTVDIYMVSFVSCCCGFRT